MGGGGRAGPIAAQPQAGGGRGAVAGCAAVGAGRRALPGRHGLRALPAGSCDAGAGRTRGRRHGAVEPSGPGRLGAAPGTGHAARARRGLRDLQPRRSCAGAVGPVRSRALPAGRTGLRLGQGRRDRVAGRAAAGAGRVAVGRSRYGRAGRARGGPAAVRREPTGRAGPHDAVLGRRLCRPADRARAIPGRPCARARPGWTRPSAARRARGESRRVERVQGRAADPYRGLGSRRRRRPAGAVVGRGQLVESSCSGRRGHGARGRLRRGAGAGLRHAAALRRARGARRSRTDGARRPRPATGTGARTLPGPRPGRPGGWRPAGGTRCARPCPPGPRAS